MTEEVDVKQGNFEGWAIVEMMGHALEAPDEDIFDGDPHDDDR
jgi:hypothetical protein